MPRKRVTKPIPNGIPERMHTTQWIFGVAVQANQKRPIGMSHARKMRCGRRASGLGPSSLRT